MEEWRSILGIWTTARKRRSSRKRRLPKTLRTGWMNSKVSMESMLGPLQVYRKVKCPNKCLVRTRDPQVEMVTIPRKILIILSGLLRTHSWRISPQQARLLTCQELVLMVYPTCSHSMVRRARDGLTSKAHWKEVRWQIRSHNWKQLTMQTRKGQVRNLRQVVWRRWLLLRKDSTNSNQATLTKRVRATTVETTPLLRGVETLFREDKILQCQGDKTPPRGKTIPSREEITPLRRRETTRTLKEI